ncbi:MAG: Asp-tRNA(Asn)/Glu-tRNA(Gln) amidotransferase subunit GatC [bacterium]|jgi:aspartyl-tRNA(Asn)/glutamyl-tRNA(Gln) amidotransferase subunit C|nr:Asp-tRNA(Asn)/Glu-tRNA(Gln) amidotransferase subunit GatC [bacterium]
MSISRDEVKHIALLSRLELTEDEADLFTTHLDEILVYVEKLQSLDVSHIEPISHAVPLFNVMRDDRVDPSLTQETALHNAPDQEAGCFRVPKVTE